MDNWLVDALFRGSLKVIFLLVILSPLILYKFCKNNKDRANGINSDTLEKEEQAKKDKETHDKYFKGQGY